MSEHLLMMYRDQIVEYPVTVLLTDHLNHCSHYIISNIFVKQTLLA